MAQVCPPATLPLIFLLLCHPDEFQLCRPTCKECVEVFPMACGEELKPYIRDNNFAMLLDRYRYNARRKLEQDARAYCYLSYFGPILGVPLPHATMEARAKAEAEDNSRTSRSRLNDDDDSGSRRHLLQRDLEHVEDSRVLTARTITILRDMEENNQLTCPPPQCLTNEEGLLAPLTSPWYHASAEGSCMWNGCAGVPMSMEWCSNSVDSCMSCKGTWCPPRSVPFWYPVDSTTYEPPSKVSAVNVSSYFPTIACQEQPLTRMSPTEAAGIPWKDPAGSIRDVVGDRWIFPSQKQSEQKAVMEYVKTERQKVIEQAEKLMTEQQLRQRQAEAEEILKLEKSQAAARQRDAQGKEAELKRIQEARDLELVARKYCNQWYRADAREMGAEVSSERESSARSLLASSSGDNGGPDSIERITMQRLRGMEQTGSLRCPPEQCYVMMDDQEIMDEYGDDLPEAATPTVSMENYQDPDDIQVSWKVRQTLPWYHRTKAGYCTWGTCNGESTVDDWCMETAGKCVWCGGLWCSPYKSVGWKPVDARQYQSLAAALGQGKDNLETLYLRPGYSYNNTARGASVSGDELAKPAMRFRGMFDYNSCTASAVTPIDMAEAVRLPWPGMIDIQAAIGRQKQKLGPAARPFRKLLDA